METDPFKQFIDLVTFDQDIYKAKKEIETFKTDLSLAENEAAALDTALEFEKNILSSAKKEVSDKELKMQELDEKEKEQKKKLELISNQKEYLLLKKETEKLLQAQHNLEPELMQSWNKLANAKNEFNNKSKVIEQKIEETRILIKEKRDNLNSTLKKIEDLYNTRTLKEINVPQEWLQKYNVMHGQVTNPVVEVINNSCTACFFNVTNQDLINLNKNKLIQCKGCFRLLYISKEKDSK